MYPLSTVILSAFLGGIAFGTLALVLCRNAYLPTFKRLMLDNKRKDRALRMKLNAAYQEGFHHGMSNGAAERNQLDSEVQKLRQQIKMEAWLDKRIVSKGKIIQCPLSNR